MNNLKVEKSIQDVLTNVRKLSNHLNYYQTYHQKLGNTISTVVNHYNHSSQEFKKINKDILKISNEPDSIKFDTDIIDRPQLDE